MNNNIAPLPLHFIINYQRKVRLCHTLVSSCRKTYKFDLSFLHLTTLKVRFLHYGEYINFKKKIKVSGVRRALRRERARHIQLRVHEI